MKTWQVVAVSALIGNMLPMFGIQPVQVVINVLGQSKHQTALNIVQRYADECASYLESQRDWKGVLPTEIDCKKSNKTWKNIVKTRVVLDRERNYSIQVLYIDSFNFLESTIDMRNGIGFCEFDFPRIRYFGRQSNCFQVKW
jgi:hypothetical protein